MGRARAHATEARRPIPVGRSCGPAVDQRPTLGRACAVGRPCPARTGRWPRTRSAAPGNAGGTPIAIASRRIAPPASSGAVSSPSGPPSIAGAGGSGPDRGTRKDVAPRLTREAQGSLLGAPIGARCSMNRAGPAKLNETSIPRPEPAEPARACFFACFLSRKESRSSADKRATPPARVRDPRPPEPSAERSAGRTRGRSGPTGLDSPSRRGPALAPGAEPS